MSYGLSLFNTLYCFTTPTEWLRSVSVLGNVLNLKKSKRWNDFFWCNVIKLECLTVCCKFHQFQKAYFSANGRRYKRSFCTLSYMNLENLTGIFLLSQQVCSHNLTIINASMMQSFALVCTIDLTKRLFPCNRTACTTF